MEDSDILAEIRIRCEDPRFKMQVWDILKSRKRNSFEPPKLDEVKLFFTQNGYNESGAINAFKYYEDGNPPWHDQSGKPVRSWKQKMRAVWFRDEFKQKTAPSHKQFGA